MRIAQIVLALLALASSASARGYGPGVGSPGNFGSGVGGGFGVGGGSGGIGGSAGRGSFATGGLPGAAGRGGYISGSYGSITGGGAGIYGQSMAPKPYKVSYESTDGQGGVQFKTESGDGSGSVQGTYGYRDAQGLYRVVEYVADQNGYRAAVNTNEPGVDGKENPADVSMTVEKTPAGIQEKYTPVASPFGTGPASAVSGVGSFGRGGPTGGYQGRIGGSFGGPAVKGRGLTGGHGIMGGIASVPGATGSFGGSSGLFSGIPSSTTGKSAY